MVNLRVTALSFKEFYNSQLKIMQFNIENKEYITFII